MVEVKSYSLRAKVEMAAYQALGGAVALAGAGAVPVLRHYFSRIDEGFSHYLGNLPRPGRRPALWVHGVSMGESLVAISFAAELKKMFPEYSLVYTSTHPDVIRAMKNRKIADVVAYFPLDTAPTMQRAFERIRPSAVFVAETDFWPVFSHQCKIRNLPLLLINGRISSKIADFYSRAQGLAEVVFGAFTSFLVQTDIDRERLMAVGVEEEKILVCGNIKADLVSVNPDVDLAPFKEWLAGRKPVIFGSLHPSEFELLKPVFKILVENSNAVLIAPRNLKFAVDWKRQLQEEGLKTRLRSETQGSDCPAMILDSMGELASVYGLASAAIVGGSIDEKVGGHNPLEVIQQRVPLLMGPNCRNFADIIEQLQKNDAIKICNSANEFMRDLNSLLNDPLGAVEMVDRASQVLKSNSGAMSLTLAHVGSLPVKKRNL